MKVFSLPGSFFPYIIREFKEKGVDFRLKYIPKEVFDNRAVEKSQVKFYDVSYLYAETNVKGKKVTIRHRFFLPFDLQSKKEPANKPGQGVQ